MTPVAQPTPSDRYRWTVLALLVGTYIFAYLDRQILGILAEPIKRDLGISDTALGFLGGTTFAIFYTTVGIPIARLADRYPRRTIITVALALWSALTALTSTAGSFAQLLALRIGVAIGEAGCNPSAASLIGDYFAPRQRATAMAFYGLGIPIGIGLGMLIGGWAGQYFGWRTAFLIVGVPGLLFSVVLWAVLREPPRGMSDPYQQEKERGTDPSAWEVAKYMLSLRSFCHKTFAIGLLGTTQIAGAMWNPAFLIRSFEMELVDVGALLAAIMIGCGGLGMIAGGVIADRLGKLGGRAQLMLPTIASVIACPIALLTYSSATPQMTLVFLAVLVLLQNLHYGCTTSLSSRLAPLRGRALAAGMGLFVTNLVAAGIGAQVVGIASDMLHPKLGKEALRCAMMGANVLFLAWSAFHYFMASRTIERDLLKTEGPAALAA